DVNLSTNSPSLISLPLTIHIPAGASTATAFAPTHEVNAKTAVQVTASANGSTKSATVSLLPPLGIAKVKLATSMFGNQVITGNVKLAGKVRNTHGSTVAFTISGAGATVTASVTIPLGASEGTFQVASSDVSATSSVLVNASSGSS